MAPNPPRPRDTAGFTMVELLVTTTILGIAAFVAGPSLKRLLQTPPAPSAIEGLASALAGSRDGAILKGRTFHGVLAPDNGSWRDADGNLLHQLPEGSQIRGDPDRGEAINCVFRADGSGCRLSAKVIAGDVEWTIKVNPITGRISYSPSRDRAK
ncbi:MAG: prepilin-type N-terminal cleavage/methylation domain-containing protein [Sulfurisoma sp.]|nr:prepilin-type N-terminal cleavage/methylation domain-containing protein [Sulfurisoma sp.]